VFGLSSHFYFIPICGRVGASHTRTPFLILHHSLGIFRERKWERSEKPLEFTSDGTEFFSSGDVNSVDGTSSRTFDFAQPSTWRREEKRSFTVLPGFSKTLKRRCGYIHSTEHEIKWVFPSFFLFPLIYWQIKVTLLIDMLVISAILNIHVDLPWPHPHRTLSLHRRRQSYASTANKTY
jgi:hypothetical protein